MDLVNISESISIVSFNLHGLNQGRQVVRELICNVFPDIILLQEHWFTPVNIRKLDIDFPECVAIGRSAMELCVEQGPLRSRPFGGVTTLVKRDLFEYVHILFCYNSFYGLHCFEHIYAIRWYYRLSLNN